MSRKWVYGKQDWKTYERGQENCYLMTNGLGGFSSMTMTGSVARNDHAFFMACTKAPNNRYNMVHRLAEKLRIGDREYVLSSQQSADRKVEEGYRYLSEFSYEDTPMWRFHVYGVEIVKEAAMKNGENTAALTYRIINRTRGEARLTVTPFYQFTPKGKEPEAGQKFEWREIRNSGINGTACRIESNDLSMELITDGQVSGIGPVWETYFYSYDACDGRRDTGSAAACHQISICVESGCEKVLSIIYRMDGIGADKGQESSGDLANTPREMADTSGEMDSSREITDSPWEMAARITEGLKTYRKGLEKLAGFRDENARTLSKSADQYLSLRASTGGKTILAGYPFFEDWGRDTMIALPGVCISTGRYEDAESILRTFAAYERRGLMPNLFPEGRNDPMYNTVDAALLFINCVWLYYSASGNAGFVEEMYPVMERIIENYKAGTDYEIRMEEDCLIRAGSGLDQVTWMDVRVGDILPTPRHGKPVEINAYWYNALRIMGRFSDMLGKSDEAYEELADKVRASFEKEFWMEEKHCLRDVVSGTKADTQIRCNQIWAVSMPFTMLGPDKERQIVDTVFEKLYTPYGLRTLEEADPEFKPFYGGEVLKRDLAYHQGTVWAYPLGAYYIAYLKVHGYSSAAKAYVKEQLEVMEGAMREGCVGQLPEIYDGENPVSSKGCFAQAWSTGEILRVYEALERQAEKR